jgi:uncharacterized protein YceH (UPF0502 family)
VDADEPLSPPGAPSIGAEEARVLGALLEKELATPEYYPLTLNSLRAACNQSSSRDPVVSYDDATVEAALTGLREKRLARIVHSPSNRAPKYREVLAEALAQVRALGREDLAVVCLLLLRGPQTAGELRNRADRLAQFESVAEVEAVLQRLATGPEPLVTRLERQPGQKEARYAQLLTGGNPGRAALEAEARALRARLAEIEEQLGGP